MFRKYQLVMIVALGLVGSAVAHAQDVGGLGKHWPNATDVSHSANFHAYRFDRDGVEYVQVNAQDGTPQLAVASGGGTILVLPVGVPGAVTVVTADTARAAAGVTVYTDTTIQVLATPTGYLVSPITAQCSDPVECTRPPAAAPAATNATSSGVSTLSTCSDPVECTRINAN